MQYGLEIALDLKNELYDDLIFSCTSSRTSDGEKRYFEIVDLDLNLSKNKHQILIEDILIDIDTKSCQL